MIVVLLIIIVACSMVFAIRRVPLWFRSILFIVLVWVLSSLVIRYLEDNLDRPSPGTVIVTPEEIESWKE